jgi:formate hydrogenlyase subunit 3/multisubunit Na+/H+ antiporter MnhD subunit
MLYYRARGGGWDVSRSTARILTLAALTLYPAGASIAGFGPNTAIRASGMLLIVVALVCVTVMLGSSLQRVVGEQVRLLDEYELQLRARAMNTAYSLFGGLVLLLIIYCAIASDANLWVPRSYDALNALFWGIFLYSSMLPSTVLAWQIDRSDAGPDGDAR